MKKSLFLLFCLIIGATAMAQNKIQFRSADKAECVKSDYTSLKATFSFSGLEANKVETERGAFAELAMSNTVIGGNEGDPQIPVVNELIAVPFGANPTITVTSYSATDYKLADFGIERLVPRQPSLRKDQKPEDAPFIMNEAAYQSTRGLRSEPTAVVQLVGTMRGVQLGKMTIEPVSYDPVNNIVRVFNDIEVEVHFDGADAKATEQMLVDTYSPYFTGIYKALFNGRAVLDAYSEHPDLYSTPVKMLVVATQEYQNSTAFQNWLTWKKQKGIDVDIYTVTSSTSSSTIQTNIKNRYNANHPTFLVIVGDETAVPAYKTNWSCNSTYGNCVNDLEYASMDGDVYHDMYMSRMSVSSTTELGYLIDKILMYEKYTMPDPTYLNNSLLVAGWDSSWTAKVGKPTIQYASNNYYNSAHGINATVYITTASGQTAAYNNINNVGFLNYTAHGDIQKLADPVFNNSSVASMTNNGKYLWIVANCCLTANWGNSSYYPCFGETMIRAQNKGAFGYIGSIPESYWYEDYYFGVGAFSYVASTVQTTSSTTTGMYDAAFDDTGFNTLNSMPYIGNVAVTYAHAAGYTSSVTDEYYWRAYQCLGDGSVMPYLNNPAANNVSHASQLQLGATSFTVHADAGSYVAITVNDEIIGVQVVPSAGSVDVPITAQTAVGTAMIVVTRNQRQPYITTIPIVGGTKYNISANASPTAGGTVSGAGEYYEDTECTLTATPNAPQYEFTNWKKGSSVVSTDASYTFTVSSSTAGTYTANFTQLTAHSITCNAATNGTISADKTTAYKGETVTLMATPAAGYVLSGWSVNNGSVTVNADNTFTMPDQNVTVSATFTKGNTITLASVMNGTISADPTCALQGMTINLTATPATGFNFDSWVVYKTGDPNTTVTVTGNSFSMPNYDVTVSAIFLAPQGGDVTIGSGTSNDNGNYVPTSVYYKYSLTQQIYTKAELGDAGTITAISFYYGSSSNSGNRNLNIYMSHTSNNTITAWSKVTSSQLVYSGTQAFSSVGWYTFTLNTPFEYNGTSNILLTVDDNAGSYNGNYSFYTYSTGAKRAIWYRSDSTNPDPTGTVSVTANSIQDNAQMKITKEVPSSDPYISLSPTALTGFTYPDGQGPSDPQTVTVIGRNITGSLTVTAPTHYEVSSNGTSFANSLSLNASNGNVQTTVYVRLKADLAQGNYNNETLAFTSGNTTQNVTLNGEVTEGAGTYYTITVSADPEIGGTVSGGGRYEEGAQVTLTATPAAGYSFVNWTKGNSTVSTNTSISFNASENATYVAHFSRNSYMIQASANPSNGGTVTGAGSYYEGTPVTLTATANTGYTFVNWTLNGSVVSTESSFTFNVTTGGSYVANFEALVSHTVNLVQVEGGTISANPTTAYTGDVITLTVSTSTGYFFTGWEVVDANNQPITVNDNTFTMPNCDVTVTAVFTQGFAVTLDQTEHGTISADHTTGLQPGDIVTLTATPNTDCVLLSWYVYKTGDPRAIIAVVNDSYFVMPASDVTVMAVFVTTEQYEAQLGSGTSTSNYIPTYVRSKYSLTQQIYLASELGNKKGTITKIAFRATTASATRKLIIYMAHTDKSAFSSTTNWEVMGSVSKVFEGNVAFSTSDWTTITLNTPFEYDGTSNLNLCVVDDTGSTSGSSSSYTKFYCYSATNRALYVSGSSSYASTVGYTSLSNTTGTRISYVNRINLTMTLPGSAESLTLSPSEIQDFGYVENQGPSETHKLGLVGVDLSNDITVTAPTGFEISLTGDTYVSSLTIPRATSKGRNVTTWGFEGTLDGWTVVDSDGDGYNWVLGSASSGVYLNDNDVMTEGHNASTDMMVSGSWTNVSSKGSALNPDNWLISPQVTLGGSFSLWAQPYRANYPAEHFGIFVSTTDANPSSFTMINEWTLSASTWKQYSVDLSAYEGLTGYIAVRHFGMENNDQFLIKVDDFELDSDATITIEYPVVITPATVFVRMKADLTAGSYSGTLTANTNNLTANAILRGTVSTNPTLTHTITVSANPAEGGTVSGGGVYPNHATPHLVATANEGYTFVNWTENGEVISTNETCYITADDDRDLVANFERTPVQQTLSLYKGWTWWSTNLDITLAQLEEAMGTNGVMVKSQNEYATFGGTTWDNSEMPSGINPSQMYKIRVNAYDEITLSASPVSPADYPITLYKGYNWIGFPCSQAISLSDAFVGFTPTSGDLIKSQEGFAIYNGNAWETEDLEAFEPGQGYIYKSNATGTQTFTFPSSAKGDAVNIKHPTTWAPETHAYADNMCLLATVNLDGTPALSDNIEVGAFVNGECRGAVRLKYIERLQQYVAFLTVAGLNGETVSFSILDDGRTLKANEEFEFIPNAFIGKLDQPVVLHAGMPGQLNLFPNPTEKGQTVRIEVAFADLEGATVEVFNTLGALVRSEILSKNAMELNAFETAGLYTVRITDREGNAYFGKLVVR